MESRRRIMMAKNRTSIELLLKLDADTAGNSNTLWNDTSGYSNNAVSTNVPLNNNVFGTRKGYVFTNNKFDIPNKKYFSFVDSIGDIPFSIKFKIKISTSLTQNGWIIAKRTSVAFPPEWQVSLYDGFLTFDMYNKTGKGDEYMTSLYSTTNFSLNTSYDIKITYDGSLLTSGVRFYVNNSLVSINTPNPVAYTGMASSNNDIQIGYAKFNSALSFKGSLTDIEIYKGIV